MVILLSKNLKTTCKYCKQTGHFDFNYDNGRFDFKVEDGVEKAHSFIGIWKADQMPVCEKFFDSDSQYAESGGFCYCDIAREKRCDYYEPINNKKNDNGVNKSDES